MVVAQQWQSPPGSRAMDLPCPQHFILDSAFRSNARSSKVDLFFPNSLVPTAWGCLVLRLTPSMHTGK